MLELEVCNKCGYLILDDLPKSAKKPYKILCKDSPKDRQPSGEKHITCLGCKWAEIPIRGDKEYDDAGFEATKDMVTCTHPPIEEEYHLGDWQGGLGSGCKWFELAK